MAFQATTNTRGGAAAGRADAETRAETAAGKRGGVRFRSAAPFAGSGKREIGVAPFCSVGGGRCGRRASERRERVVISSNNSARSCQALGSHRRKAGRFAIREEGQDIHRRLANSILITTKQQRTSPILIRQHGLTKLCLPCVEQHLAGTRPRAPRA